MSSFSSTSGKLDPHQLRPYYDHDTFDAGYPVIFKKGVGLYDPKAHKPITTNLSSNSIENAVNQNASGLQKPGIIRRAFDRQGGGVGIYGSGSSTTTGSFRDKNLYDLEFNEYFDPNNLLELVKNLLWNFVKSYLRVLIAQPLEITRLVLQVGKFNIIKEKKKEDLRSKRLLESRDSASTASVRGVGSSDNGNTNTTAKTTTSTGNSNISSNKYKNEDGSTHFPTVNFAEEDEPIDYFQPQNDQLVWASPLSSYDPLTQAADPNATNTQPLQSLQSLQSPTQLQLHLHLHLHSSGEFRPPALKRLSTRKRLKVYKIQPKSLHTIDIISAITQKDSFFALFRGVNASFFYQTLSHTIEAWITGFLSPFLGIPDPFFLDLTHSNDPFRSLWLSVGACVLTGLALMPLDLIRVKLMITQPNNALPINKNGMIGNGSQGGQISSSSSVHGKEDLIEQAAEDLLQNTRSVRELIRYFPTYYLKHPPTPIVLLTTLYQLSSSIFRKMAPYILFIKFNIDSYSSPAIYTFVNLISLICEFFIKLPVENLLRKEQVAFLLQDKKHDLKKVITIVKPEENLIVDFNGLPSLEDAENGNLSLFQRVKSLGLFNGWRVGLMNVVGFWGYNIIKLNGSELQEERL
ncbi:conserved hypothetical protein [Lodderomyces elongisporus NRRL YB-4239]|uniref:Mitochondrial fusion and transport protein UGO1 n=1 Tax=Lodderomyces elongisporus (strain ATCC 11503 / CBS 2605 / JCM 1781 / NBRC 1676 / NRRL YB-4239) TaxID=379508 RepID=A5E2N8_LODEL|nr:conserved hypothetical protein [Lodderomyces elongisporus NRRL YB-4239]